VCSALLMNETGCTEAPQCVSLAWRVAAATTSDVCFEKWQQLLLSGSVRHPMGCHWQQVTNLVTLKVATLPCCEARCMPACILARPTSDH
jgi:hypothetical protein